tara:strand:- start:10754 stop:13084 length:2331 start_codon:yes stop_codon:yes gene_type:complete
MIIKKNISCFCVLLTCYSSFANVDIRIEAESAILTGETESKNNDNASGGAFVLMKNQSTLTFTLNGISEAGKYRLNVYNFNNAITQDVTLTVNGVSSTAILQPSNWAYQGPAKLTSLDIALNPGENTIELSYLNIGVSLDFIQVIGDEDSSATSYYMSIGGNDANDGLSEGSPWQTIDKLNQALAKDSNGGWVTPGTKILFRRGDAFYGHLKLDRSGTEEDPIVFSSYGNEINEFPILSGSGGTLTEGDYFQAVTMTNSSHILMTKIWVKNDRTNGSRYTFGEYSSFGIKLVANRWGGVMRNITFRDVKVSDVFGIDIPPPSEFNSLKATGIRMESEANIEGMEVAIKDVLVEDSYFSNIGKAGVWCTHKGDLDTEDGSVNRNQNIVVRNNTFYRTGGSGVIMSKTYKGLIENNDFEQTGFSNGIETRLAGRGSGAWVFSCQNIIAQYNRSYGVQGPNDSYGMHIDFGNKDIIFQYNYSEESEGGFCEILGKNINSTYRFNVSVNDGIRDFHGSTIWVSDFAGTGNKVTSENNYIYNNTIYLGKNYAPDISIISKNTYIYNNIFRVTNGVIGEHVTVTIDAGSELYVSNNLFDGNIHNDFTSLDSNSQSGDPLFVNEGANTKDGYVIQNGSPAIDNGKSFPEPSFPMAGSGIFSHISTIPTEDTFGLPVDIQNVVPNIGASNASNSYLGVEKQGVTEIFFNVYPNPVTDVIKIHTKKELLPKSFVLYDVQGRQVYSNNFGELRNEIELPQEVKNGIYYLKVTAENTSQAIQIILYR